MSHFSQGQLDTSTVDHNDFQSSVDTFRHVYGVFFGSLSSDEKNYFPQIPSDRDLVQWIRVIIQSSYHDLDRHKRLNACMTTIERAAKTFRFYFEAVDLLASPHPEFAALAWGALGFLFKLGCNYVTFLERICEMLRKMTAVLPAYEGYINFLAQQIIGIGPSNDPSLKRILKSMAFVYSDLMEFCLTATQMFSRRNSAFAKRPTWPLTANIFWEPFNDRVDVMIERFTMHSKMLNLEMSLTSHMTVMEIQKHMDFLNSSFQACNNVQKQLKEKQEKHLLETRLHILKSWISPPQWLDTYENAIRSFGGTNETVDWFLNHQTVDSWFTGVSQPDRSHHRNILFAHGKPGFGKTALCAALVRKAQYYSIDNHTTVLFYFFDKQQVHQVDTSSAFRAMLCQLLEAHGGNRLGVDLVSLLWSDSVSVQSTASDSQIEELLQVVLMRTDQPVLFFDGIDECKDQQRLFEMLKNLCLTWEPYPVALFGRPTVQLPFSLEGGAAMMPLVMEQNINGIRRYLHRRIPELIDQRKLPRDLNVDNTVTRISERADGMFLWVRLLLEYLSSAALTNRQREKTIKRLNRLSGLDALYKMILESLSAQYTGDQRRNTERLFWWVSCASRSLHVSELETAVGISATGNAEMDDDSSSEDLGCDGFENFKVSLSNMSGALLEVDVNSKVRFIHLSALEYFTGEEYLSNWSTSQFDPFRGVKAKIYCAMACLSYMQHTVRHGPLSGSSQTFMEKAALSKEYPFLDYVCEFWPEQILEAISPSKDDSYPTTYRAAIKPLLSLTAEVLDSKRTISTWIEASWTFGHIPRIIGDQSRLSRILEFHRQNGAVIQRIAKLDKLSKDLRALVEAWGDVLRDSPNEIWEPSISAFMKSDFWEFILGSKVTRLEPSDDDELANYIVVNSRPSADGKEIGVIKVLPPKQEVVESYIVGASEPPVWWVRFEIWSSQASSKSDTLKFCKYFSVPSSKVPFPYMYKSSPTQDSKKSERFIFPTSLSADLRQFTFLNVAGTLQPRSENGSTRNAQSTEVVPEIILQDLDFVLKTDPAYCGSFDLDWSKFTAGYWTYMSDSGQYLLVLNFQPVDFKSLSNQSESINDAQIWFVRIYQNMGLLDGKGPKFSFLSAIAYKPRRQFDDTKEKPFVFHPDLPILVFAFARTAWIEVAGEERDVGVSMRVIKQEATVIWNFGKKGSHPFVIEPPLKGPRFSNDNTMLYGVRDGKLVATELPFESIGIGIGNLARNSDALVTTCQQQDLTRVSDIRLAINSLAGGPEPPTHLANTLAFGYDRESKLMIKDLNLDESTTALVRRTLQEDVGVTHETLTRLPRCMDKRVEITLLPQAPECPAEDDNGAKVRISLDRNARVFERFSCDDSDFAPSIIERAQETIPTFVDSSDVRGLRLMDIRK